MLTVVRVEPQGDGYLVTVDGETYRVQVIHARAGELVLEGARFGRQRAQVAAQGAERWVALPGAPNAGPFELTEPTRAVRRRAGLDGHDALTAQMPGVVRQVLVAPGDTVVRGQVLVVLEAMKMEIKVTAPRAGRVQAVTVVAGQTAERGQVLVDLAA